jgi:hypothetical protein
MVGGRFFGGIIVPRTGQHLLGPPEILSESAEIGGENVEHRKALGKSDLLGNIRRPTTRTPPDTAGGGLLQTGQKTGQGTFSGAIGTHQGIALSGDQTEIDPGENIPGPVVHTQSMGFDERHDLVPG